MSKRDMFECAKLQYKVILANRDLFEVKDSVLINCQQMIEMVIKGLLKDKTGTYPVTNSIGRLLTELDRSIYKKHKALALHLTSLYYTNRYESDEYEDLDEEEYNEIVTESIDLYKYLLSKKI